MEKKHLAGDQSGRLLALAAVGLAKARVALIALTIATTLTLKPLSEDPVPDIQITRDDFCGRRCPDCDASSQR